MRDEPTRLSPARRIIVLTAGVAMLAVVAVLLPLRALPDALAGLGPAAPALGTLAGAALLVALVPRTPVSVACGALFGPAAGALCAILAACLAAAATFVAGRALGREWVAARMGRRLTAVDEWIGDGGVLAVATVRCIPIAPFGVVGYAFGASSVRVPHYLAGTVVNVAPSAISYAIIGAAVARPDRLDPVALAPAALGLLFSVVVAARTIRSRRARRLAAAPARPRSS